MPNLCRMDVVEARGERHLSARYVRVTGHLDGDKLVRIVTRVAYADHLLAVVRVQAAPQPRELKLGQVVLHVEQVVVQLGGRAVVLDRNGGLERAGDLIKTVLRIARAQAADAIT